MTVKSKRVFSSHIDTVAHDDVTGKLTVTYQNGKTSVHDNVPAHAAEAVMNSASIGAALHEHIRGKYPHSYLEKP